MEYKKIKEFINPFEVPEKVYNEIYPEYKRNFKGSYRNAHGATVKAIGGEIGILRAFLIEWRLGRFNKSTSRVNDTGTDNKKSNTKDSKGSTGN